MGQSDTNIIEIRIAGSVEGDLTVVGERIVITIEGDVSGNISVTQSMGTANVTIAGERIDPRS